MSENETIEEEEEQSQTVFMQTVSNTIQECEVVLERLKKEKKRSGNRYTGKRKSNSVRNTQLKIVAVKVKMNAIRSRLVRNQWAEIEFQDLPMGTVFRAVVSLEHSTKTNKDGSEKKSGAKEYVMMKSCGPTAFILSVGYDQGSMLDFKPGRAVWARQQNKMFVSKGRGKSLKTSNRDNSDEFADDWDI
jgi:hypothetical protein